MAKKKQIDAELSEAEKAAQQRLSAIREYNMNNMGQSWIDPEKVPTEDDVNEAKNEYETRAIELRDKKDYLIADKENALRVAKFMKDFITNGLWLQRYFVGVINFDSYITEFINECEKEAKPLEMEYGPMQFAYLMFENYGGFGLEAAKHMAEIYDEYVPIYDTLRDHIEFYQKESKEIEKLKNRWAMLAQGYYLVYLDGEEEANGGESADASTADAESEKAQEETLENNEVVGQ